MTAKESKAVALFTPEQLAGLADKATNRANREAAKSWPPGHDREITARNLQQRYYAEYITPPKMTFAAMQSALHAAEAERDEWRRIADSTREWGRTHLDRADKAEAELGKLRRRVGNMKSWAANNLSVDDFDGPLASDGGADGDNEGEGK